MRQKFTFSRWTFDELTSIRRRSVRAIVAWASLAVALVLVLGCGDARGERTVWVGHPSIVLCDDQSAIFAHAPGQTFLQPGGAWQTIHGVYDRGADAVYLLCSNPDGLLTVPQALFLCHELQHRADARNGGSMWDLLQDESSPNGHTSTGGIDFDQHHHHRISPEGGTP